VSPGFWGVRVKSMTPTPPHPQKVWTHKADNLTGTGLNVPTAPHPTQPQTNKTLTSREHILPELLVDVVEDVGLGVDVGEGLGGEAEGH